MPGKEICVKVGKTTGEIVHCFLDGIKKTGRLAKPAFSFLDDISGTLLGGLERVFFKFGNVHALNKYERKIAEWQALQKEVYAQLGKAAYGEKEGKQGDEAAGTVEDNIRSELTQKINYYDGEIQKVREEMARQKDKMDEFTIVKRAKSDLRSRNPKVRRVAVRVLEKVSNRAAIPVVSRALNDPDPEVREEAVAVMYKLVDKVQGPSPAKEIRPAEKPVEIAGPEPV